MLQVRPISYSEDNWAERWEYWRNYREPRRGPQKKFKYREPLILCGHGVDIRIDHDTLLIRNGFTHYPQEREQFRFFPGDANLPDRIIMLDRSGAILLHALSWVSVKSAVGKGGRWPIRAPDCELRDEEIGQAITMTDL